jgi:exosortase
MATEISPATRTKPPVQMAAPPAASNPLGLVFALIVCVAFVPLFILHGERLWALPHYQFFPFAILGAIVLAWSRWRDAGPLEPGDQAVTFVGVLVSWLVLAGGELVLSPTMGVVSALVLLATLFYGLGSWAFFRHQLPTWIFLWIIVPLPFGLDKRFVLAMQTVTSKLSSWVLDLLGVFHQIAGNVVEIAGNRLLVEEACAGVNSLFSLIACSLFLIFFLRRPWLRAVLLVVATLWWVIFSNVVRVTVITFASYRWQADLVTGWKHEAIGFACFVLAVCLIWSTDRFFLFLKPRWTNDADPLAAPDAAPFSEMFAGFARLFAWPAAIAFGFLLAFHLVIHGVGFMNPIRAGAIIPEIALLDEESLPPILTDAKWQRSGFKGDEHRNPDSAYGEFSKVWSYRRGFAQAMVSIDYPFPDFHDLKTCYINQGWTLEKEVPHPKKGNQEFYVEAKLKSPLKHGYLLYAVVGNEGQFLEAETVGVTSTVSRWQKAFDQIKNRFKGADAVPEVKPVSSAYQFQVFSESLAPFTEADQQACDKLFFTATILLHNKLFPTKQK